MAVSMMIKMVKVYTDKDDFDHCHSPGDKYDSDDSDDDNVDSNESEYK